MKRMAWLVLVGIIAVLALPCSMNAEGENVVEGERVVASVQVSEHVGAAVDEPDTPYVIHRNANGHDAAGDSLAW
jgi:hypothetical protein